MISRFTDPRRDRGAEGDHTDNRKAEVEAGTKAAHGFDMRRTYRLVRVTEVIPSGRFSLIEVASDALQIRMRAEVDRAS
jgi:hypothetical protein